MTTWAPAGKVVTLLYYWSIWQILAPVAKVFIMRDFLKNSTDPWEAIESWNWSLAQFLDEQEAKQKWRHYPTVTTLPHLRVCTQLRIFQKEIKSTLNQELIHISKSDYNLKSGCTQRPKVFVKLKKKPKNPLSWTKKNQKNPLGWFFFKPGFFATLCKSTFKK